MKGSGLELFVTLGDSKAADMGGRKGVEKEGRFCAGFDSDGNGANADVDGCEKALSTPENMGLFAGVALLVDPER